MRRWALSAALCLGVSVTAQARPDIWFGPRQEYVDRTAHTISWTYYDCLAMLEPNAPWQTAAHRISTLALHVPHASEGFKQHGVPSLPAIKAMITRLGVKVAGGGSVVATGDRCKVTGVEGMTNDPVFAREAYLTTKTWHDEGLPMDYFVMDSPYYFAGIHMKQQCGFSPEDVADRAAATALKIKELYPNVQIVAAEGPGEVPVNTWLPDFHRFLDRFKADYGAPVSIVSLDMHWDDAWHTGYRWVPAVRQVTDDLHRRGMKVSLIVDASSGGWDPDVAPPDPHADPRKAMTAQYWMAAIRKHIDMIKANALPVDSIALDSWMPFPRNNLPETDPTAWTSAINYAHDVLGSGK